MKKNILKLTLVAIVATFIFNSCQKDPTKTEMLTTKNGWELTAAESSPAYEMSSGIKITNLFNGYFEEWELDDILIFKETGAVQVDPGKKLPPEGEEGYTKLTDIGTWAFLDDETKLKMKIPFFYDDEYETVDILVLDKNTFKFNFRFRDYYDLAKDNDYVFTLTYTKK